MESLANNRLCRRALFLGSILTLSVFSTSQPAPVPQDLPDLVLRRVAPLQSGVEDALLAGLTRRVRSVIGKMEPGSDPLESVRDALQEQGHVLEIDSPPSQYIWVINPTTGEEYRVCIMGARLTIPDPNGGPALEISQQTVMED